MKGTENQSTLVSISIHAFSNRIFEMNFVHYFLFLNPDMGNLHNFTRSTCSKEKEINKIIRPVSGLTATEKWSSFNVNIWEDQLVEEAVSDWEAFHPRQYKPSSIT
jgi:hypothetical protein